MAMFSFKRPYIDQAPIARTVIIWIGLWVILLGMNGFYTTNWGHERTGAFWLGVSAYIVWFATVFLAYQAMTHILLNAVDALGPGALICINGPALLVWMLIILSYVLCLCHGWGFMFESQCRSGDIWSGPCGAMRAGMAQIAILSLAMLSTLWAMSMGFIYRGLRPEEDNMVTPSSTAPIPRMERKSETAKARSV